MIPKKPAPDLIRGGNRLSEKIMLKEEASFPPAGYFLPGLRPGSGRSPIRMLSSARSAKYGMKP